MRFVQMLAICAVRHVAGEQFVKYYAQRIDIAASVDLERIGEDLLRAHVGQRANQLTKIRLARSLGVGVSYPGNAEIENLGLPRLIDQYVTGLQIAMDDAALVGMLDRLADTRHQFQPLAGIKLFLVAEIDQGPSADELHREEWLLAKAGVLGAGFVDLGDTGVLQPPERLGFLFEAPQQIRARQAGLDYLEGNTAIRILLFGFIDGTHAAFAKQSNDSVIADACGHKAAGRTRRVRQRKSGVVTHPRVRLV